MSPSTRATSSWVVKNRPCSNAVKVWRRPTQNINDEAIIRKVLAVDEFEIHYLSFNDDTVTIMVNNTKFRSQAQAVGRIASTLQDLQPMTLQLPTSRSIRKIFSW